VSSRPPKRPRDLNQWAKHMVDLATGAASESDPDADKNPSAVAKGRKGGLKGGKARAERLGGAQRSEIARKAANTRWKSS
jgi:hypothetical protein